MKTILLFSVLIAMGIVSRAQEQNPDSLKLLDEVIIRSFEQNRSLRNSTVTVRLIKYSDADRYNKTSLVNGFNSVAGVRMEERSPGSYRINIRGSSLRSPFGVRNVKVYWNDLPMTDPGGNTYFNQFAYNNFSTIEIFKGPASSLYGAGTGGLVLINYFDSWQPGVNLDYVTGSYNLQNILATARFGQKENRNQLSFAHNSSDGYRQQTKFRRDNFSWSSQLHVSDKQQLTASVLFSDLYYQTPGALTLAEYQNAPKAARPGTSTLPSAVAAKAAIFQKNLIAGFTNKYMFNEQFNNTTSIYGAYTQVKNSAIRNYERRNEPQYGARTTFVFQPRKTVEEKARKTQFIIGGEFQNGYFNSQVSDNRNGQPDTLRNDDDIHYSTYSLFAQADLSLNKNWMVTAGVSLTKSRVGITRLNNYPVVELSRSYQNELAPRLALLRKVGDDFSIRASVAKGFSPPTTAELLPSTGIISTELEAEQGWNYEMTLSHEFFRKALRLELTGFYFKLKDALVQRRDLSGADFFVNAGEVNQKGIEVQTDYSYVPSVRNWIDYIMVRAAYTYNHFRYGSFIKGLDTFSHNQVPSVPANTGSIIADLQFRNGLYLNLTYYHASKIYLNDANSAVANAYDITSARVGWKYRTQKGLTLNFHAGIDNAFDEKYSLGNDINAAANRFYNAAPGRNYYVGVGLSLKPRKRLPPE